MNSLILLQSLPGVVNQAVNEVSISRIDMLLDKLRVPSIVGMIFAGVLIGPHGFGVLERDTSFELFGKVGLYYICLLYTSDAADD